MVNGSRSGHDPGLPVPSHDDIIQASHALSEADDQSTPRLAHETVRSSWQQQRAAIERQATGRPA